MAPIKIFGNPVSTCTQRVLTVIKAKGLEYEMVESFGIMKSPEFISERQPFGQVPAIQDGDFKLYESRAICLYLASKYADKGDSLLPSPTDTEAMAKVYQGFSIESFNFDPYVSNIAVELVFKPRRGETTDQARLEHSVNTLETKLKAYDAILAKSKYLTGDKLTVVDLFHLPYGSMAIALGKGKGFETNPNVARWWKDITSYEPWKFAAREGQKAREALAAAAAKK